MTLCNASSCGSFETVNSSTDDGESLPSLDDRHIAVIVIQSGVMAVIMLLSVLGNSLVLAAIYRDGQLKNTASVYVANLAIADFLNGALAMPFILTCSTVGRWPFGAFICCFVGALTTLFCSVSVFTLGTIAIDRYLAILHPLQYNAVMTRSKIIFSIALTWLHAVVLSALPIMGWSTYAYIDMEYICTADWGGTLSYTLTVFAIDLGFPVTTMFFCYYHVLKTARKHSRQVASCQVGPAGVNGCPRERCFCQSWRRLKSEMKAAITLLAVIGTFLFCWLPHVVTMVCLSRPHNCHFPDAVFAITTWLAMANSACNPLIYGILNRQFRQAFRDILCVWKARRLFSR